MVLYCPRGTAGAMSVFTTRSLLGALGVANKNSGEAAAAINWVVKDGAGRLGRFLFARWCVSVLLLFLAGGNLGQRALSGAQRYAQSPFDMRCPACVSWRPPAPACLPGCPALCLSFPS